MKQKLIEVLSEYKLDTPCETCKTKAGHCRECAIGCVADHLIDNGVTIQKWIPVSERLPELNVRVLVLYRDKIGNEGMDTDRCWGRLGKWVRFGDGVTHWMPLPEPPKGD